jgi:hypothetical protein
MNEQCNEVKIFKKLREMMENEQYSEQTCGPMYLGGTIGTNFLAKDELIVVHISVDICPDEEVIESLKEKC